MIVFAFSVFTRARILFELQKMAALKECSWQWLSNAVKMTCCCSIRLEGGSEVSCSYKHKTCMQEFLSNNSRRSPYYSKIILFTTYH